MNITKTRQRCWKLLNNGRQKSAIQLAQKFVRAKPSKSISHKLLSEVLIAAQQYQEAYSALQAALNIEPNSAILMMSIGQLAQELGRTKDALEFYSNALAQEPTADRMAICGHFLLEIGHLSEAEQLLRLSSGQGNLNGVAGLVLLLLRKKQAAEAADLVTANLNRISEEPSLVHATARLLLSQEDPQAALEVLQMVSAERLSVGVQILHFRLLGESFHFLGQQEQAFQAYQQSNTLRPCTYDPEAQKNLISSICARFQEKDAFEIVSACTSDRMIFIVGMPRSGSSVLEQILSMDPNIYAAGELDHLPELIKEYGTETKEAVQTIAAEYLKRVNLLDAQTKLVTDKLPHNYMYLGDIAKIFPKARIIYCRRDPIDTGWSCYRQNFHSSLDYATDLWSIGHYQARLMELMQHWSNVLPLPLCTVQYEELIADPAKTLQTVFAFCNLDWNPNVLNFHQSKRSVHTASSLQVQKPLYSTAIRNAQPYLEYLQPLVDGLQS